MGHELVSLECLQLDSSVRSGSSWIGQALQAPESAQVEAALRSSCILRACCAGASTHGQQASRYPSCVCGGRCFQIFQHSQLLPSRIATSRPCAPKAAGLGLPAKWSEPESLLLHLVGVTLPGCSRAQVCSSEVRAWPRVRRVSRRPEVMTLAETTSCSTGAT